MAIMLTQSEKSVLKTILECYGTEAKTSDMREECGNAELDQESTHTVITAYFKAARDLKGLIDQKLKEF